MSTPHVVRHLGMECFIFATVLCGEKVVRRQSKEYSSTPRQPVTYKYTRNHCGVKLVLPSCPIMMVLSSCVR